MKKQDDAGGEASMEFVKPADIAGRYAVSTRTVHNWIESGLFPVVRQGKVIRIRLDHVVQAMEKGGAAR